MSKWILALESTSDFDELNVKIRYQVMFGHVIYT